MEQNKFSFSKRIKSFSFAFNGLIQLIKHEHNSRIHLTAAILVIVLGAYLNLSKIEWALITIVIGFVITIEIANTAIEKLADIVDSNWNEKIGNVKDYGAAAVLISSIVAVIVGGLILIPKLADKILNF